MNIIMYFSIINFFDSSQVYWWSSFQSLENPKSTSDSGQYIRMYLNNTRKEPKILLRKSKLVRYRGQYKKPTHAIVQAVVLQFSSCLFFIWKTCVEELDCAHIERTPYEINQLEKQNESWVMWIRLYWCLLI